MAGLAELQATTWENRDKKPSDAVSDKIPLLYLLRKKGNVKVINGGRVLWEPIRIAQNGYVQLIDSTEEIALGYNDTISQFEYAPKIMVVPVILTALEQAENQGDAAFLDLLEQRNQTAEDSMMNVMEANLQGDGTSYGGKAFAGIRSYISDTPSLGVYGGLSRVTYSSIRNIAVNAVSTFTGATDASNVESRLRTLKNQVVRNGEARDYICLAGSTYFNAAADAMSGKQRFTSNQDMYEAGFDNVMIEGMPMVLANGKSFSGLAHIPADRCYGINLNSFALKMYKGFNFQPSQKRISINQLLEVAITVAIGQFTCNGAGTSFVMFDS